MSLQVLSIEVKQQQRLEKEENVNKHFSHHRRSQIILTAERLRVSSQSEIRTGVELITLLRRSGVAGGCAKILRVRIGIRKLLVIR
jgi:hypothetical protein